MFRHHPQWHEVAPPASIPAGSDRCGRCRASSPSSMSIPPISATGRDRRRRHAGHRLLMRRRRRASSSAASRCACWRWSTAIRRCGTDRTASFLADFGEGRQFSATLSTQAFRHQRIGIIGTSGRIEMPTPFSAPTDAMAEIGLDMQGPGAAAGDDPPAAGRPICAAGRGVLARRRAAPAPGTTASTTRSPTWRCWTRCSAPSARAAGRHLESRLKPRRHQPYRGCGIIPPDAS